MSSMDAVSFGGAHAIDGLEQETTSASRPAVPAAQEHRARARVLVAIPCFNEEVAVASIVLRARRFADEVLVVDDGSEDRTAEVAVLAGATVVRSPTNEGKGSGVRRAFRFARAGGFDCVVFLDGDGQHDPEEIPGLVGAVLDSSPERADVALGFRFGTNTQMPLWRRVGKRVLDYVTAAGGARVVTDSQCGFRAFGRRAIEEMDERLTADGFVVESEQLVRAREAGLTLRNVPIRCRYSGLDSSTKGPVEHAMGILASMIELVTTRRPLLFLGLPSILLLGVAFGIGVHTLKLYNQTGFFSVGFAVMTATMAFVGVFGVFAALILNVVAPIENGLRTLVKNRS